MYSLPFACFVCRKSFKIAWSEFSPGAEDTRVFGHRCPQCGGELSYCRRYFKAPPSKNERVWLEIQRFILQGNRFD